MCPLPRLRSAQGGGLSVCNQKGRQHLSYWGGRCWGGCLSGILGVIVVGDCLYALREMGGDLSACLI